MLPKSVHPPSAPSELPPAISDSVRIVAWHIRTSDRPLHVNDTDFFNNIHNHLVVAATCAGVSLLHFFFSGDVGAPSVISNVPPPGFAFLTSIMPNATYISSSTAEVDVFHFTTSHVLVGSGSSFAHAAAFASSVIYIEVPPKEDPQQSVPTHGRRTTCLMPLLLVTMARWTKAMQRNFANAFKYRGSYSRSST